MLLLVSLLLSFSLPEAIIILTGVTDVSQLSEDVVSKYEILSAHPIPLNRVGRAALASSELFSSYQIEAILDYRSRNGDILSAQELAVVDGFNAMLAECLGLFLDFSASGTGLSGGKTTPLWQGDLSSSCALKSSDSSCEWQWIARGGVSCKAGFGNIMAAGAMKSDWSSPVSGVGAYGWNVAYAGNGSVCTSKAVVGHYNARFGQGLAVWTGSSYIGQSTPSSLMRKPSDITPYGSYNTDDVLYGVAARIDVSRFSFVPFVDFGDHRLFGANLAWNHRHGEVGFTFVESFDWTRPTLSLDFQQTIGGCVLYGEATLDALALGARCPVGTTDIAARLSCSEFEHNVLLSSSWISPRQIHSIVPSLSVSYFPTSKGRTPQGAAQLKIEMEYIFAPNERWRCASTLKFRARALTKYSDLSAKYASSWNSLKFDFKQVVKWDRGDWQINGRFECLRGVDWAFLGNVEAGYKCSLPLKLSVYFQTGIFKIDDWDDRIYVYRRDAPLSFSTTAMYGRGCWAAAFLSCKPWRFLCLYLRADIVGYPFAREGDTRSTPTASAKLQLQFSF